MTAQHGPAGRLDPDPPLRRDAARNRERLLDAAREVFAEHGLDATLNDVAHHAGVGVGTAYRRFANKEELFDALFGRQVEEIVALADVALADPDPWHALTTYLEAVMAVQARDRGIAQVLSGSRATPAQHDWARDVLAPKVIAIAERAKASGDLRADVEGTDLVFLQVALLAVVERTKEAAPAYYLRVLHVLLDGLRARPDVPSPLPVAPLGLAETHAIMGDARSRSGGA